MIYYIIQFDRECPNDRELYNSYFNTVTLFII